MTRSITVTRMASQCYWRAIIAGSEVSIAGIISRSISRYISRLISRFISWLLLMSASYSSYSSGYTSSTDSEDGSPSSRGEAEVAGKYTRDMSRYSTGAGISRSSSASRYSGEGDGVHSGDSKENSPYSAGRQPRASRPPPAHATKI